MPEITAEQRTAMKEWEEATPSQEVRFDGTYQELCDALTATGRKWSITHRHPKPEVTPQTEPRGVDLEICEKIPAREIVNAGVITPRWIKINGVETYTPADRPILELSTSDGKHQAVTATLNVYVRSLIIHAVVCDGDA